MKTPAKPTRVRRSDDYASHLAAVLPWGAVSGRIAVEQARDLKASPTRQRLRADLQEDYPAGKAVARLMYFLQQRGPIALPASRSDGPRQARAPGAKLAGAAARFETPSFKVQAKSSPPLWRELGPTLVPHGQTYGQGPGATPSVSGRCCGLMVDRNDSRHLVLCSAGGGLWGSHDAGATWTPLTDRQPTLIMGAIAQSASAPAIVYAATGDGDGFIPYGIGLLRSSDGGDSWSAVPLGALQGVGSYDLAIHPAEPLKIWIATDRGLYASTNGGDSVKLVAPGRCWSVAIHPTRPDEILAAQEAGLLRSVDGGASWKKLALAGITGGARISRLEVCFAPSDGGVAYVAGCVDGVALLWRRGAYGAGFIALSAPSSMDSGQAWYDWCFSVAPDDPDNFFWGAIDLFHGQHTNGAVSWQNVSSKKAGDSIHPDQHFLAFDPNAPGTVYACNDGGLFRSPDLGVHWVSLNPGLGITEFEFLTQLETDPTWLMGGTQDNGTLSVVADKRWDQIALGDGGDCAAIDRGANSICYHSYYDMPLERAKAHGPNAFAWSDISPPVGKAYPALFYPPMDARGSTVAKAGSTVWVSGNEGKAWYEIALPTSAGSPPDLASALTVVDDSTILLGMVSGGLWRITKPASSTWAKGTALSLGKLATPYVSDLCAVGSPLKAVWAACSHSGHQHLFRSNDGGNTFVDCTGDLPDYSVNAVVADPKAPGRAYIATDHGIFRTLDGGKRWTDFSNGMPNAIVGCLLLHGPSGRLIAGTRSRGAWELRV